VSFDDAGVPGQGESGDDRVVGVHPNMAREVKGYLPTL
jgi:hypothetical protein